MSDAPLLLSSAKTAVLVDISTREAKLRLAAMAFGAFVVVVGAANLASRAVGALGPDAGSVAFAPAIAAVDPKVLGATATTTGSIIPARLRIPSIGVDAKVEQVTTKADGTMGTPSNFDDVAWYSRGGTPGGPGSTVIDGHVNNALTKSGVFSHLDQVKPGDYITVADTAGKTIVYRVTSVKEQAVDDTPTASIFGDVGHPQLVLITCAGEWVSSEHQYNDRLVVIAQPAY